MQCYINFRVHNKYNIKILLSNNPPRNVSLSDIRKSERRRIDALLLHDIKVPLNETRSWDYKHKISRQIKSSCCNKVNLENRTNKIIVDFLHHCVKNDWDLDVSEIEHILAGDYKYVIGDNTYD